MAEPSDDYLVANWAASVHPWDIRPCEHKWQKVVWSGDLPHVGELSISLLRCRRCHVVRPEMDVFVRGTHGFCQMKLDAFATPGWIPYERENAGPGEEKKAPP